ncbi:MAG: hypothetical protein JSW03_02770, partial [Candidatus Eiseniibacteriota bacterium]
FFFQQLRLFPKGTLLGNPAPESLDESERGVRAIVCSVEASDALCKLKVFYFFGFASLLTGGKTPIE